MINFPLGDTNCCKDLNYISIEKEVPIPLTLELPPEILEKIFSYLNSAGIQQANLVSSSWRWAVIDFVKHKEYSSIANFGSLLASNLSPIYIDQINSLSNNNHYIEILNSVNLIQVKLSIFQIKGDILYILKNLKLDNIIELKNNIENERKSKYLENLIYLSEFGSSIKEMDDENFLVSNKVYPLRNSNLREIFNTLKNDQYIEESTRWDGSDELNSRFIDGLSKHAMNTKSIEKVLRFALNTQQSSKRISALQEISLNLSKEGHIDSALDVSNMIFDDLRRDHNLKLVFWTLIKGSSFDEALETAIMISNDQERDKALTTAFKEFMTKLELDKAFEIASMISKESTKNRSLEILSRFFIMKRESIGKALQAVSMISQDSLKTSAFVAIIKKLMDDHLIEEAMVAADQIEHEPAKNLSLEYISKSLFRKYKINDALDVAQMISDDTIRDSVFMYMCSMSIDEGKIKRALKLVDEIADQSEKDFFLLDNSVKLMRDGYQKYALKAADMISDRSVKSEALCKISEIFISLNQIGLALELAETKLRRKPRNFVFQIICSKLLKNNDIDSCKHTVDKVSSKHKDEFLYILSFELLRKKQINRALEFANAITTNSKKDRVLFQTAHLLFTNHQIEEAIEIAETISSDSLRIPMLRDLHEVLKKHKER